MGEIRGTAMGGQGSASQETELGWAVGTQGCSGNAAPIPGSDLLHWLLLLVLRLPDKRELWLLAHLLEVVGPQGQGLGGHTPGSQALGSGCHL